ncbi:hypothetical protein BDA96_01G442100 [Sorghum bicolor]|uniref:Uncharacterized protein n=1 Tax=Sorghum bicolor TaxID=4558 RepID=A0A921S5J4_SORBI|nr:hypothetical protein BDA96_01G442100 [Sorghum bicolor]
MQENTEEQGLVREDNVSSISHAEERRVLEEELGWARLERQKILALSAEADDAIWHLASLARRRMQERDEARNQARMLLADLQARNARMLAALPGTPCSRVARPDAFAATGYRHNQALPPELRPLGGTMVQGQRARAGTGYCAAAPSSGFGHRRNIIGSSLDAYAVQPSLHDGFASTSQDHFDPDMFLVDVAESPQDVVPVPATAESCQGRSSGSGTYGHI